MDKKNIEDLLALTPVQQGMLYHYLKDPGKDYYFEQLSLSIRGEIEIPRFRNAWAGVVKNHETLRTVFHWEEVKKPTQIVLKYHQPRVETFDYPGTPGESSQWKRWIEEIKINDRKKKFNLTEVPFRVTLCKIDACRCEMILSYHHILCDGWSNGIILKEFFETYNGYGEGAAGKGKRPGKTTFKEYVRWIQNQDVKKQERFWKHYLRGIDTRTMLPAARIKARHAHDRGIVAAADYHAVIPGEIRESWDDFVKTHRITLADLIYTAWGILLQRYNNSKDVIYGTTISGRSVKIKGIEDVVGLLINTLPLRVQTVPGDTAGGLLKRVHETLQRRENYETTSLADIKAYCQRDNQDEMFDSIVVVDNYPLDNILMQKSQRITVESYSIFEMSNYNLTLGIALLLKEIKVKFSYHTELFAEENIAGLFDHLMNLLLDITANPGKSVTQLQLLTAAEKKRLLVDLNDTDEPYPVDKTIHERFEQQVENTPDTIALVLENERFVTYKQTNRQANRWAHRLRARGVKAETTVAILGEYSLEMAMGLMAILKAGAVYATISPDYPEKRVEYILKDSQAKILLTQIDIKKRFPRLAFAADTIEIAEPTPIADRGKDDNPDNITIPAHLAFILYTSGSTGKPKGVLVEHRNVNNLLSWFGKTYGLRVGRRVLQLTDYTFDPHVEDIFGTLFFGGTLCVVGKDLLLDMAALRLYIEDHQINLFNCVPSLIKELLCRGHRLTSLDLVITGGDRLDDALKDELIDRGYLLFNHYGLIETTVDILVSRCTKTVGASTFRPLANSGAYIVDQDKNLLPGGAAGELSVSGNPLARGYLNQPGSTHDRFPRNPFKPGERMFLTGDLANLTPAGHIEIMDRMDHQVKVRGFRIEPGEIENQLVKHKDIKEAAVTAREDSSGSKYLCAYVVPEHNRLAVDGQFYHIFTTAQQPGFKDKIEQIHAGAWPAFFMGDEINVTYWKQLYDVFPGFQAGLVDEAGSMIAAGNSIPIAWNGTSPGLPEGWDDAVVKGFATASDGGRGAPANTLCVLAGVVNQAFKSKGMSYEVIRIMKRIAREKGFEYMIIPVRVTEKEQFPGMNLEEYCEKKRDDGLPVDPWLRVHLRLGGKIIGYCHASQRVKGTIKEWETWTGHAFAKNGSYVVPGAMQPVDIDIDKNRGTYNDLAVWVQHSPAQETEPPITLLTSAGLRDYLSLVLPHYMVPTRYVFLEKIPLTPLGKRDRNALPAPEMVVMKGYTAPRHEIEHKLLEIWAEVLGLDKKRISTTDNFFELGGHSLRATEVVYRVRKALKVKLELKEFMKEPVILTLAEKIKYLRPLKYREISPVEEKEYYPLSYAQRRLWIICQFEEDSASYNMVGTFTITGPFSPGAFEQAIRTLVKRQGSFRTVFLHVAGTPKQRILRDFNYNLDQVDLRVFTDPGKKEQKIRDLIKKDANRVFDLETGPLFLFKILQLSDEEYILIVNIHHIINDGWSLGIINNEILTLYNAYLLRRGNPLPPLALQYKDYTLWHNGLIEGGHLPKYGQYWLEKFKDKPGGIELPLDHPRPPIQTFNGGRVYFTLEKENILRLKSIYAEVEATLFMKLLTLMTIFLYKYTGQTDIMIGAPISGRNHLELYQIIGFLVNTLVYRVEVNPVEAFPQLLGKVKQETMACFENREYPFDLLVEHLELDRDLSRSPLFNVMLALDNTDIYDLDLRMPGIDFVRNDRVDDYNPSVFDLVFIMDEEGGRINGEIMYNSDLFDRSTIARMAENLKTLLADALEGKDVPIGQLNYIHEREYQTLVQTFNRTEAIFPPFTLQEMFEHQVQETPGKIAVADVDNKRSGTYDDLNRKANRLAHYLREEYRVKPGEIIGISMDRSLEMMVALLGIVKAGAGYVAIDTNYPEERALHMLADSRCQRVIIDRWRPELFENYQGQLIHLHRQWEQISGKSPENPIIVNEPGDIIYVIYTSGSTGTPNGAMLSQALLSNLVQWQHNCTSIDSSGRCLQFTTISFCVSFQEIFTTLTAGGELHLIDDIERRDIDYLMNYLVQRQVELLYLPFSYLNHLFNESSRWGEDFKPSLQHIITAGEQLKITSGLNEFLKRNPGLQLHNHYGSSEMHVVTSYTLEGAAAANYPVPPAGKPIANTKIFILDDFRQPVPIGVWGELCIAGSAEIAGYINNETLTEKKLLRHPLSRADNRLYISGDIGRWLPDGNIELRGRKDTQIKIRGFRVELSEIESKLLAIDRVKDCVVVVKEKVGPGASSTSSEQKYLVAYVVLDSIEIKEIKQIIAHSLPLYMIPQFMVLEELPLMPNGKVDRENLPEPGDQPGDRAFAGIEADKISSLLKQEKMTGEHLANITSFPGKAGLEKLVAYSTRLLQESLMVQPFTVNAVDTGLLTAEKRKELLVELGGRKKTRGSYLLQQLFEDQAARTPDHIALLGQNPYKGLPSGQVVNAGGENSSLTYRELNEKSTRMAHYLRSKGVKPGILVGVMKERSLEIVIGILGILKAGGAYMVIDPAMSTGELNALLAENKAALLLTGSSTLGHRDFTGLQGLYTGKARMHITAPRPPLNSFDRLPIPDRSLVNYEKYREKIGLAMVKHTISLQTTRGCPYHCLYCHKIWPKHHVVRPAESILEEITLYYKMGMRRFVFVDDIFNLDIPNSERFFKLLLEKGLQVRLFFPNGLRADLLTRDYIDLMVKAGTVSLGLALETASPRLQKLIKKNMNLEKLRENIEYLCQKYPQVILELFLMHGFPTETEEEALRTLDFLKSLHWVDFPYFHILKIYPNSEMAKLAVNSGISPEAIEKSASLAFHELPETLPFERNFTLRCQTEFLNDYFLVKERLLAKLPHQMQVLTENEIVQKYDSYLPVDITGFDEFLAFAGIERAQLRQQEFLEEALVCPPGLNQAMRNYFPARQDESEPAEDALRVLLLDLSQFFSGSSKHMLYDGVEPPLGLMYLLTYLEQQRGNSVKGRIAKSGIDFDNYNQLKTLLDEFKPQVIGIRTLTYYKDFFHQTVAMIRGWGIDTIILAGGPYASSDYKTLLQDRNVDLVVLGEGEITFLELIETIGANQGKLPAEEVLKEINGIVFARERETPGNFAREILMVDAAAAFPDQVPGNPAVPPLRVNPAAPVNLYYIPGKKGKKEVAALDHQGVLDLLHHLENSFYEKYDAGHRGETRLLASYLFDLSPEQIFTPLLKGSVLYILPGIIQTQTIHLLEVYKNTSTVKENGEIPIHLRLMVNSEAREMAEGYVKPRDSYDGQMIHVWAGVLGLEPGAIGIDDNFFELGGHSLKATTLIAQIHKVFNVNLKLIEIFKTPTIREIAEFVRKAAKQVYAPIEPVEKKEYYDMSYAQRRLWIVCQFEKESTAYNMAGAYVISGEFDTGVFKKSLETFVHRHESLRTVFIKVNGEPHQKIFSAGDFSLIIREFDFRGDKEKENKTYDLYRDFANQALDLEKGPLVQFGLVRLQDNRYLFMNNIHHIVNDGWSIGVITNELICLYNALLRNRANPLPALQLQYKDYTLWHNRLVQSGGFDKAGEYWLDKFKDKPNGVELPVDHTRKAMQTFNGNSLAFSLDEPMTRQLLHLSVQRDATIFMTAQAAFSLFLYRYTGQTDIIFGAPVAGRRKPELKDMIGFLVNTLVYRYGIEPGASFNQLLERVKQGTLDCFENQDYPFNLLVERLELDRDLSQSPLFNVMLAYNNLGIMGPDLEIQGIDISRYEHIDDYNMSLFDLVFFLDEMGERIEGAIMYNSDLFEPGTVRRMADNFLSLLQCIIDRPGVPVHDLDFLHEAERESLLKIFNDTAAEFPSLTLQQLVENQVEQTPDSIALVGIGPNTRDLGKTASLGYHRLNQQANRFARYLGQIRQVRQGDMVGICMDRSLEMIIAILGIVKAGAGYVAVDPNYPGDRVRHMLADSHTDLVVIDGLRPHLFEHYQGTLVDIISDWQQIEREPAQNPGIINAPGDIVYVIYTSGSTGMPNGAMLSQAILANLLQWQKEKTAIDGSMRCLQFTSINFCVSFQEIFTTLTAGGQVHLIGDIERQDIDYLMDFLETRAIEVLYLPFSYLNFLFNESNRWDRFHSHSLRHIITAGEQLKISAGMRKFLDTNPGIQLHNHYGSSEMHVVTSYSLDAASAGQTPVPPAGKPIANTKIYILDDHHNVVPIGVWGELYVDGSAEIAGYIHNPGLTAKKMLAHPSLSGNRNRLYRSGDIGRWLENGNIELRGRKDNQVKIRGFRIEPGEIEGKLLSLPGVSEGVVVVAESETGQKHLVAYVVLENIKISEIQRKLNLMLPRYMIPVLMKMDRLPLMPNGKVDRDNLPRPEIGVEDKNGAPTDEVEEKLAALWAELLELEKEKISIHANFFDLGGHSLKATLLMSRMHKEFNVDIDLIVIFRMPTICELAEYTRNSVETVEKFKAIEPVEQLSHYPVSSAQKRLYIIQQMEPESTAYNMLSTVILAGELKKEKLADTFRQLIRRHESLRTSFEMIVDQPVQKIHQADDVNFSVEYYDSASAGTETAADLLKLFDAPFNLSRAPLLRVGLIKIPADQHILMVDLHHIVSDGLSLELFVKEFMALYQGEELPSLPIRYRDFASWQNSLKLKPLMKKQAEYWLTQFQDKIPVLELPADFERPPEKTFRGKVMVFEIDSEETRCLKDLAREEGATLFMVLAALFNVLLAKISGMEDLVVGTPVAGRRHADLRQVIGMFVNTLPLRNYPSGEKTFRQFLGQVKTRTLEAFNNQDYQFEDLVEKLDARRDSNRTPLFDVMFALQNKNILSGGVPALDTSGAGLTFKPLEIEIENVKFDLLFYAFEVADIIECVVKYSTDLFKEGTIRQMNRYFLEILRDVIKNPDLPISQIQLISKEEEDRFIKQLKEKKGIALGDQHRDEIYAENSPKTRKAEFDF